MEVSAEERRFAYGKWLRTARWPAVRNQDGVELKFNPWHDPDDGRFTFAGQGINSGSGHTGSDGSAGERASRGVSREGRVRQATRTRSAPSRVEPPAQFGTKPRNLDLLKVRYQQPAAASQPRRNQRSNPVAEFISGVEGVYDTAKETAAAAYSAPTTNPVTTVRNAGRGIADMIDKAIAAEDTPARVQVSRAAEAIANASPRDVGRAVGSTAANAALAVAPGAGVSKLSTLHRLRTARPRPVPSDPPPIGWRRESARSKEPWKKYNDTAPGARADQAPALMRTMPDGSKRRVKFDGVEGDYLVDRKWSIGGWANTRAQFVRQSAVLAEHRLTGTLEVPNAKAKRAAIRIMKSLDIRNIKVRFVLP